MGERMGRALLGSGCKSPSTWRRWRSGASIACTVRWAPGQVQDSNPLCIGAEWLPGKPCCSQHETGHLRSGQVNLDLPNCEKDWQQMHKSACLQSSPQASLLNCGPYWSPHAAFALTEGSSCVQDRQVPG